MDKILNKQTKFKAGFSLLENFIVLFVLGVIIMLTVPQLVENGRQKNFQNALRKSLMTYEGLLKRTLFSHMGIRDTETLNSFISHNNCEALTKNLSIEQDNGNCVFLTSDGIWWDASTPSEVIVSFDEQNEMTPVNAANEKNNKVFYIPYKVTDQGSIKMLSSDTSIKVNGTSKTEALKKTTKFLMNE